MLTYAAKLQVNLRQIRFAKGDQHKVGNITSATLAQHWNHIGLMCRVFWDSLVTCNNTSSTWRPNPAHYNVWRGREKTENLRASVTACPITEIYSVAYTPGHTSNPEFALLMAKRV